MNPFFTLLIKQLPRLLPVVKALMDRPVRTGTMEDGRVAAIEQSVQWLAERSDALEKKIRRLTWWAAAGLLLSLVALAIVLSR